MTSAHGVVAEVDDVNYEGAATNTLQIYWPTNVPLPTVTLNLQIPRC